MADLVAVVLVGVVVELYIILHKPAVIIKAQVAARQLTLVTQVVDIIMVVPQVLILAVVVAEHSTDQLAAVDLGLLLLDINL
jgi:hypothetical protein